MLYTWRPVYAGDSVDDCLEITHDLTNAAVPRTNFFVVAPKASTLWLLLSFVDDGVDVGVGAGVVLSLLSKSFRYLRSILF